MAKPAIGPQYEDGSPLISGRYRTLYAFEHEGTAEMVLEGNQIVYAVCRGGGVGWVTAEKENGDHALVPGSYIQVTAACIRNLNMQVWE